MASLQRLKTQRPQEYEAWKRRNPGGRLLRDLRARGLKPRRGTVADAHLGLWAALAEQQPTATEQRCWNHKVLNFRQRYRVLASKAIERLHQDWERLVTFYRFPKDHRQHVPPRTWSSPPFAAVRLRTTAGKRSEGATPPPR